MKLEDIVLFDRKDNDLLCSVLSTDLENKLEHVTVLAVETDDIAKILYCRDVKSYVINDYSGYPRGVRPVVSLISGTLVTGEGTSTNPYVVK